MIFIESGMIDFGFSLNKEKKYCIRKKRFILGLYESMFEKRCYMLVRAFNRCEGYFIRIDAWKRIMRTYPEFVQDISIRAAEEYQQIWTICDNAKQKLKERVLKRRDFKHIIMLDDPDTLLEIKVYLMQAKFNQSLYIKAQGKESQNIKSE